MDSFFWKIKLKNQNKKNVVYFFEKLSQLQFFIVEKLKYCLKIIIHTSVCSTKLQKVSNFIFS